MDPLRGVDLRHKHFSPKMCVKMKELAPMGRERAPGTPPRSANAKRLSDQSLITLAIILNSNFPANKGNSDLFGFLPLCTYLEAAGV